MMGEDAIATGVVRSVNSVARVRGLKGLEFFELFGCEDGFDAGEECGAFHGKIAFGGTDCGGGGADLWLGCA